MRGGEVLHWLSDYCVGFEVRKAVTAKCSVFLDVAPNKPSNMQATSKALLAECIVMVSCLAYSSTLKMDEINSAGTLVDFTGLNDVISQKI
jgi:hypothetical protein